MSIFAAKVKAMKTRKLRFFAAAAALLLLTVCKSSAQNASGQKDWRENLSSRISYNGYAQAGFDFDNQAGSWSNSFAMRRVIIWIQADITDRWSFRIMNNFSGALLEYYTDFRFSNDKSINLRFGQFKNSFSLENPLSPASVELVDVCSQPVTLLAGCFDPLLGAQTGRDLGMMLFGDLLGEKLHYELAIMNGQGMNCRDGNNDKDFIVKLEGRPLDGFRVVASAQKGRGHAVGLAAWNPEIGIGDDYTRDRYSVGAEYKWGAFAPATYKEARPISLRGEWLGGRDGNVPSRGAYLTACFPLAWGIDAIASGDWLCRNTLDRGWDQTKATFGLQYWFYKRCRLQLQYTRSFCGANLGPDYDIVQSQFQISF